MTKFEQELRKLFDHDKLFSDVRFVGNTCYGRLTDQIRVKVSFQTGIVADRYDRLKITLLNRNEGPIDSLVPVSYTHLLLTMPAEKEVEIS